MKSEWRVRGEYIGGKKMYGIHRLRDITKEGYPGNIETGRGYYPDRESAEQLVRKLNAKGGRQCTNRRGSDLTDSAKRS